MQLLFQYLVPVADYLNTCAQFCAALMISDLVGDVVLQRAKTLRLSPLVPLPLPLSI